MAAVPDDILSAVQAAQRVLIAGHVNPDADCLGSMGALALALRSVQRAADVAINDRTISSKLSFLLKDAGVQPVFAPQPADLAIIVDTAKPQRVNLPRERRFFGDTPVLNIDHHATNPNYGRWNWVAPQYSSTAEMIFDLIDALGAKLDEPIATLLYAGVHADTMGFSLPTTTPSALAAGVRLARAGARIGDVCERLYRSRTRGEFDLLATIYRNTRMSADRRLAWSSATFAEMHAAGASATDIDDQVEVPRSMADVRIAMLFTESDDGKIRINFRGDRGVNVLKLAEQFGGGGHAGAAGARMRGPIAEVIERVVAVAGEYLRAESPT